LSILKTGNMYLTQELTLLQNKMVYFVGTSDLEISNETEKTDLILTLNGFLVSLENQKAVISELSKSELELFYNKVFQATQDFVKIQKRLEYFQFFGNTTIRNSFNNIIIALKELRKDLLKNIEGDLVEGVQKLTQGNISRRLISN
jgi:hypothetical protein